MTLILKRLNSETAECVYAHFDFETRLLKPTPEVVSKISVFVCKHLPYLRIIRVLKISQEHSRLKDHTRAPAHAYMNTHTEFWKGSC